MHRLIILIILQADSSKKSKKALVEEGRLPADGTEQLIVMVYSSSAAT